MRALKPDGVLTIIHRADRQDEIVGLLAGAFGRVEILPVLPKADIPVKRVIIRAYKGGAGLAVMCKPLILHKPDGGYSDAAEEILRHAKEVAFTPV